MKLRAFFWTAFTTAGEAMGLLVEFIVALPLQLLWYGRVVVMTGLKWLFGLFFCEHVWRKPTLVESGLGRHPVTKVCAVCGKRVTVAMAALVLVLGCAKSLSKPKREAEKIAPPVEKKLDEVRIPQWSAQEDYDRGVQENLQIWTGHAQD